MKRAEPSKLRVGSYQLPLTHTTYFGNARPLSDDAYSDVLKRYGTGCQFPEMIGRVVKDSKPLAAAAYLYREGSDAVDINLLRACTAYRPGFFARLTGPSFDDLLGQYALEVIVARDSSISVRRLSEDVSVSVNPLTGSSPLELGYFERRKVGPTDRFILANGNRTLLEFSIELGAEVSKNYALLVGARSNLAGVDRDIPALRRTLIQRGFSDQDIHQLYPNPSKREVLAKLDEMAQFIPEGSTTWFAYSGHGSRGGLCVGAFETISSTELYAKLANIKGNKLVLLDACHTIDAKFLEGRPDDVLVFTGQDKSKHVLYDAHVTRLLSLDGKDFANLHAGSQITGGLLTAAFLKVLHEESGPIDLKYVLPKAIERYHRIAAHNVEIRAEGKTMVLGKK